MTNENHHRDRATIPLEIDKTRQVRRPERADRLQPRSNFPATTRRVTIWERKDGVRFRILWPRTPARRVPPATSTTTIPVDKDLPGRLMALAWTARISQGGPDDLVVRAISATEFAVGFQPAGESDLLPNPESKRRRRFRRS